MALKSTIYKISLQISDMERHYYGQHALTVARHPSETDERMMVRILAFACHASERLEFGKGLSQEDEPDLYEKDLTGSMNLWIDVGLPAEKLIRKAAGQSSEVILYAYGGKTVDIWLRENRPQLEKIRNLRILNIPPAACAEMTEMAQRAMDLQFTLQDGQIWFSDETRTVHFELERLLPADQG